MDNGGGPGSRPSTTRSLSRQDAPGRAGAAGRTNGPSSRQRAPGRAGATERANRPATPGRGGRSAYEAPALPDEALAPIRAAMANEPADAVRRATRSFERAVDAYEHGRYEEALRFGKPATDLAPEVPPVRQLAGLAAYRAGRWRDAIRHLQAYTELSGDPSLVPVLMDSCRAAGRHSRVRTLWTELRQGSPEPDVLAEARIVAAATLADDGHLDGAISLLADAGAGRSVRNPAARHIRQWYVLGDLYERAGDLPSARRLFTRVVRFFPDAYDASARLRGLGPERASNRSRRANRTNGTNRRPAPSTDPSRRATAPERSTGAEAGEG